MKLVYIGIEITPKFEHKQYMISFSFKNYFISCWVKTLLIPTRKLFYFSKAVLFTLNRKHFICDLVKPKVVTVISVNSPTYANIVMLANFA